jgi:hypothetical protein
MDQKEFIHRLSEIAEVKIDKQPVSSGAQTNRLEPIQLERQGKIVEITSKENPTWGVVVKRLKPIVKPCEDCGEVVKDRRVQSTMYSYPKAHWRKNCVQCRKTQDPETKQFTIPTQSAQLYFTAFLKKQDK